MLFKRLLSCFTGVLLSLPCLAQFIFPVQFSNEAVIWQGMNHRWDEGNHRYNRCGSIIETNIHQQDSIRHSGASGSLRDRLYFNTRYAIVKTPDIAFLGGVKDIDFKKNHIQKTETIPFVDSVTLFLPKKINGIPIEEIDDQQISVILNGFDMISLRKGIPLKKQYETEKSFFKDNAMVALSTSFEEYKDSIQSNIKQIDTQIRENNNKEAFSKVDNRVGETSKLFKLDIFIDSLKFNPYNRSLQFKIFINFGTNCNTIECKKNTSRRIIRYLFRIGYLIMVCNKNKVVTVKNTTKYAYNWNCKQEIFHKDSTSIENISLSDVNEYQAALPMFKKISISTFDSKTSKPKAFHLQELTLLLNTPQQYQTTNLYFKDYKLSTNLFYKTWRRGNHPFSFRSRGKVILESDILILAIKKTATIDYSIKNFENVLDFKTTHFNQTSPTNQHASKVIPIN